MKLWGWGGLEHARQSQAERQIGIQVMIVEEERENFNLWIPDGLENSYHSQQKRENTKKP